MNCNLLNRNDMNEACQRRAAILFCCVAVCFCVVAALRAQQANDSAVPTNGEAAAQTGDFKITVA